MTIEIKKKAGKWLTEGLTFDDHDQAIKYALLKGASTIKVQYSPSVGRAFARSFFEQ